MTIATLTPTANTTLHRRPARGSYDLAVINAIIDEALVCHLAFVAAGQPVVLPTAHARLGRRVYVHGAPSSRMLEQAGLGPVCLTFTLIDGLVLARSAAKHSMNYRSAVLMGQPHEVTDLGEKRAALTALVEHVVPGRSREIRVPSDGELKGTQVLALDIEEASAKARSGPPVDLDADYALETWAGVVPLRQVAGRPEPDPRMPVTGRAPSAAALGAWGRRPAGEVCEWRRGPHLVSTDLGRIDVRTVHRFLSEESYWAAGLPLERFLTSLEGSIVFGLHRLDGEADNAADDGEPGATGRTSARQIGFARVLTDRVHFAWLADVFVLPEHRGQGLGRWLMDCVMAHPELQGLRRFLLATRDAHDLYSGVGFRPLAEAARFMERTSAPAPRTTP
jgi:nitroimidazol reductase NimA-like FMN-containing flavoprotein (pyridoxamine 5'-phosphate oxidase superfamily)/GNAT superfamily N-acetyltransferase